MQHASHVGLPFFVWYYVTPKPALLPLARVVTPNGRFDFLERIEVNDGRLFHSKVVFGIWVHANSGLRVPIPNKVLYFHNQLYTTATYFDPMITSSRIT